MNQGSVPPQIGPYTVERLLAQGGMGAVYLGRHPHLGYEVAIKVLLAGRSASDDQRARFRQEVAMLAKLEHPGLVTVLGEGEEKGIPWFAMRRVEGSSLAERLQREGPLSPGEVVRLGKQLCLALSKAHEAGILHRDLKPDNVLCTPTGQFVVTDFGLAKDLEVAKSLRLSRTGVLQGTPGYWSPEQATGAGKSATPATDVYGLGATLYAALTDKPPVDASSWVETLVATREVPPIPPQTLRPEVPDWLQRVVLRCLEKRPQDRYASMQALHAALERAGPAPGARANTAAAIGAGLALGVVALVVALAWPRGATHERAAEAPDATLSTPRRGATPPPAAPPGADVVRQARRDLRRTPSDPQLLRQARELLAGPGGAKLADLRETYVKACLRNPPVLLSETRDLPSLGVARWFDDQRIVVCAPGVRGLWRWDDRRKDEWQHVGSKAARNFPRNGPPTVLGSLVFIGGGDWSAWGALCYPRGATAPTRRFNTQTPVTSMAAWGPPQGRQLLAVGTMSSSGDKQGTIFIFDPQSGERLAVLRGHRPSLNLSSSKSGDIDLPVTQASPEVCSLAFSRDGRWLISGGHAGDVIVWDVNDWTVHKRAAPTDGLIVDIALHPTGPLIAIATELARAVHVLRIPELEEESKLTPHGLGFSKGVRFSRDGRLLFSISGEAGPIARVGELLAYDLETQLVLHKRSFNDQALNSIDLSPDGRRLVTYSWGKKRTGVLQVWEIDVPPG